MAVNKNQELALRLLTEMEGTSIFAPTLKAFKEFQAQTTDPQFAPADFARWYIQAVSVTMSCIYGPLNNAQIHLLTEALEDYLSMASTWTEEFINDH